MVSGFTSKQIVASRDLPLVAATVEHGHLGCQGFSGWSVADGTPMGQVRTSLALELSAELLCRDLVQSRWLDLSAIGICLVVDHLDFLE